MLSTVNGDATSITLCEPSANEIKKVSQFSLFKEYYEFVVLYVARIVYRKINWCSLNGVVEDSVKNRVTLEI
jgi:hypothetical protein